MRQIAVVSESPGSARGDKYLLAELFFHLAGLAL